MLSALQQVLRIRWLALFHVSSCYRYLMRFQGIAPLAVKTIPFPRRGDDRVVFDQYFCQSAEATEKIGRVIAEIDQQIVMRSGGIFPAAAPAGSASAFSPAFLPSGRRRSVCI